MATEQEYLAKPPSACCFTGNLHSGTPRGRVEDILELPTYISHPLEENANGNVVLYFPDVWGLSNNAQLMMDGYAAAGYLVLGLDYFRGVISHFTFTKLWFLLKISGCGWRIGPHI
jgi:hypothetical protein